ncbi:hypothetical protein H5410_021162 [Solanum commersonii]|uniref:Uncharacterized protein n=1 Tax=Solanum commersonii TaxID=4109 RepID=A0A9J5ZAJ1_SOLCO|nr:hypothetical protein H5410_021162 [Solanum commersonii]
MTNSYSSLKLPVPLEIENPYSFNFSIPPPEESPSTPVYGVGETGESITPHTKVVKLRSPKQVPHNVQPVFDQTPKSFVESEKEGEEEKEVPLVWRKKGIRGANILTVGVPDLETVKSVPDTDFYNELAEFAKERKRKGKGKMVESHTKGNKKKYGTMSEMHKVMGSDIAANVIQTERAMKEKNGRTSA